jgi:hypothetical protein
MKPIRGQKWKLSWRGYDEAGERSSTLAPGRVAAGNNLFRFCLGRDQLPTFRGPLRQLPLFAATAGRNRRGNAIAVFRVGLHRVVE